MFSFWATIIWKTFFVHSIKLWSLLEKGLESLKSLFPDEWNVWFVTFHTVRKASLVQNSLSPNFYVLMIKVLEDTKMQIKLTREKSTENQIWIRNGITR